MKKNLFSFLILFVLFSLSTPAQEICDNAIDDDGNGLIDLNDTSACVCSHIGDSAHVISSLIPNPSFEQRTCCPNTISQMNCAVDWIQATIPTTDYLNTCGFICNIGSLPSLLPFPDGNACVATIFTTGWAEYVGSCLLSPLLAGQSYTIRMHIASGPFDGSSDICNNGNIFYGDVDISLFGTTNCANMPISTTGCPPLPAWQLLGIRNYTPVIRWDTISITFTPTQNINAIILGPPCILPSSYNNSSCLPYFYFDNLILNTSSSFTPTTIVTSGAPCMNNVTMNAHTDTSGGSWQWYRDGIAIVGQTDSILHISASSLGDGYYTARYLVGGNCEVASDFFYARPIQINQINHTNVLCHGESNGTASANVTGGAGTLSYSWNTTPVQTSPIATNLHAGTYTLTITDGTICSETATVTITEPPDATFENFVSICDGENYTINSHVYTSPGNYSDIFSIPGGCDSTVNTHLSIRNFNTVNQSIELCQGENYFLNNHTYTTTGIYYDSLFTSFGCDSIIITDLLVNPLVSSSGFFRLCEGDTLNINNQSYYQTGTYNDTLQSSTGCDSIVITNLLVNPNYTSTNQVSICTGDTLNFNNHSYYQTGIYYDDYLSLNGCDSIVITDLNVHELPVVTFPHPDDVCVNIDEVPLVSASPAGGNYSGIGITNNVFYPGIASVGTHPITYSYTNLSTSCSSTIKDSITVLPMPPVELTLDPKAAFSDNARIIFKDISPTSISREWDFGDNYFSNDKVAIHTYKDTGEFNVKLVITDKKGCRNTSADFVYIGEVFSFYVPNAFTPNLDGLNDFFSGFGTGIKEYKMSIYNRWGKEIFVSNELLLPWSGDASANDTYIYKIHLTDMLDNPHEYTGHVTVVK
jgi:gliding motility-associated-like protein